MAEPTTYTEEQYNAMIAERDALKANRDEVLKEAKAAKAALKNYDGVDPSEFKALKDAAAAAELKKAQAEGDFSALKKQLVDAHATELASEKAKTNKAMAALEKRKVAQLTDALVKADVRKDMLDLLVLKGSASVRLREGEDDYEEYVADEKGNPLVADGSGTPMTVHQFVEKNLKAQYPGAFNGSGSSGGGAIKSSGGASGAKTIAAGDNAAFLANLDGIASGSVEVR